MCLIGVHLMDMCLMGVHLTGVHLIGIYYIVDFASVVLVCLGVRNTGEAGEKLLRNRDERVASYFCHNLAFTRGYTEAEEVLYDDKVGCLDVFCENPLP
jgi:hypothetical protein